MGISTHNAIHSGRNFRIGDKGVRTYTRTFRVITDDPATTVLEIAADGRTPRRGDIYAVGAEIDTLAQCTDVRIDQQAERTEWLITADYSTDRKKKDKQDNPLLQPAKIEWLFNHYQKPVDKDRNGTAILNAAKDPFDPPVTIDDTRLGLKIVKNLASYNVVTAFDYTNAINSDYFMGGDPYTWKCREISTPGEQEFELDLGGGNYQTILYYPTTFLFDYRKETWRLQILNAGYRAYVGSTTDKRHCLDDIGVQVNFPWPLSSDGTQLASNSTGWNYLTFQIFDEQPFSALSLP